MIKFKQGVFADRITPEVCRIIEVANLEYALIGLDFIITSLGDGKHMKGSKHYKAMAVDGRTRTVPKAHREELRDNILRRLGSDYDVVLETTHMHMEHDPK